MASSDLEWTQKFLGKGIVFSTNNRFSGLLKQVSGTLKTTVASKSSSNAKSKKTSSVKIVQSIKSNKTSL